MVPIARRAPPPSARLLLVERKEARDAMLRSRSTPRSVLRVWRRYTRMAAMAMNEAREATADTAAVRGRELSRLRWGRQKQGLTKHHTPKLCA